MISNRQLIDKINSYGKQQKPFFLVVDFEQKNPQFFDIDQLQNEQISVAFPTFQTNESSNKTKLDNIIINKQPISYVEYKKGFDVVQHNLHYGNSFLTNYTTSTPIELNCDLNTLYEQATAKYKINFKNQWVCFSPEIFVQTKARKIYSYPMKGTIDASIPNAEKIILNDAKEKAEHYTIVDLIRNDLSMVAHHIQVNRFRYIDTLKTSSKTLLQVSSEVCGELPMDYLQHLGDIIFTLLPAGSISGAPKAKTIEIIQEAESEPRCYYTGVAFYFDGKELDSCVLIRFVEKINNKYFYKSGGGITTNSIPEKEYQELIDKIYVPSI